MRHGLFLCVALLWAIASHAAIDPYEFDNEAQRQRYQHFIEEMRCPKCQNQNLAGSDAPIATDLRRELHRLLQENYSDQQIVDYMVARYGEFILYKPPLDKKTMFLWLAPGIFLLIGIVALGVILFRRRATAEVPPELTAEEQQRLRNLLGDDVTNNKKDGLS